MSLFNGQSMYAITGRKRISGRGWGTGFMINPLEQVEGDTPALRAVRDWLQITRAGKAAFLAFPEA